MTWGQVSKCNGVELTIQLHQNLARKKKIKKAASFKLQARLTMDPGACRMNLEREENNEGNHISK